MVSPNPQPVPRRPYGKSRIPLSVIGFGGIVVRDAEPAHAARVVAEAYDRGVNYFDVAPSYGDAEVKLGPALQPYRKNVFLACKTMERTAAGAQAEMKASMEHLRTDYFDLYQLHAISDVAKDVDTPFAKGSTMELLMQAKKDGRVRHLGFSAHSVAAALTAMDRYDFDSILVPVNFATFYKGNFGPQIIEAAQKKGLSILALKMLAKQKWASEDHPLRKKYTKCWYEPLTDRREIELAMRFTLCQPITAAIPPGEEDLFRTAIDLAPTIRPLDPQAERELKSLAASLDPVFVHA